MLDSLVTATEAGRSFASGDRTLTALRPASFTIAPGARIALTGPSGSGKSTLLALIAGLDTPSTGRIAWPALGPRESLRPLAVGMAFQAPSLLPMLNVVENVSLPLALAGQAGQAEAAASAALASLGLLDLAGKLPTTLSGGQAQRVALARALAVHPRLLLADEPTGQLDHATAAALFDALLAALEGTDTALLVATHDAAVAMRFPTRWHLDHGRLATPEISA